MRIQSGGLLSSAVGLLASLLVTLVKGEIVAIWELARHGARGPQLDVPGNSEWLKPWGAEQLTGNGMRMQFHLGREIRLRYPTIFDPKTFKMTQMQAISTNWNRTISSAISHMTGVFDLFNGTELPFPNGDKRLEPPKITFDASTLNFKTALPFGYTPVPIISKFNQRLLQPMREDCPYGVKMALEAKWRVSDYLMANKNVQELMRKTATTFGVDDLSTLNKRWKGQSNVDIDTLFNLADYVLEDYIHNPDAKISKTNEKKDLYTLLDSAYSAFSLARFNNTDYTRNIISEMLFDVRNKINDKARNPRNDMKYFYYSAHDDIFGGILQASNIITSKCHMESIMSGVPDNFCDGTPDLSAAMVWELHKENTDYFVKTKYNKKYIDFCVTLDEQGDFNCTLEEFQQKIDEITNEEYKDWCLNGYPPSDDPDEDPNKQNTSTTTTTSVDWTKLVTYSSIMLLLTVGFCLGSALFVRSKLSSSEFLSEKLYMEANNADDTIGDHKKDVDYRL